MKNIVVALIAILLFGCSHTVEPGTVGVVTNWGDVQSWTYPQGFHWIGVADDVYDLNIQVQSLEYSGQNHVSVLSSDRLEMGMDLSIQYRIHPSVAPQIFNLLYNKQEGRELYTSHIVEPAARGAIRDVVSGMAGLEVVQHRSRIGPDVNRLLQHNMRESLRNTGLPEYSITVVSVQVRNIRLPERLRTSIEAIQEAENQALQAQQETEVARQQATRNRITAEGAAAVSTIQAQNAAEVRLIEARSNAEANREISRSLSPELLELRRIDAQRAIASGSDRTLIIGGGSNMTPIIDLGAMHANRR